MLLRLWQMGWGGKMKYPSDEMETFLMQIDVMGRCNQGATTQS
jgi:hypothetical protein